MIMLFFVKMCVIFNKLNTILNHLKSHYNHPLLTKQMKFSPSCFNHCWSQQLTSSMCLCSAEAEVWVAYDGYWNATEIVKKKSVQIKWSAITLNKYCESYKAFLKFPLISSFIFFDHNIHTRNKFFVEVL